MATGTAVEVVMPQMGVSVSEGTVTKWLRREGERVVADEPLLEISTDKVDTEVPSPGDGVVQQILVQEGETVPVGTRLAVIAPDGAITVREPQGPEAAESEAPEAPAVETEAPAAPVLEDGHADERTFVSPVVARIASEHGIDVGSVPGTGHGGRVTKKDILGFIDAGAPPPAPPPAEVAEPQPSPPPAPAPRQQPQAVGETLEPM